MASTSAEQIELDPAVQLKIDTAKQKKDTADQAFKAGELKAGEILISYLYSGCEFTRRSALRSYHEVIFGRYR
jgi:hypothetical protein